MTSKHEAGQVISEGIRANYQLGFDGERLVGEELSRLHAHGYVICHGLPFDGFNIDHVLVGAGGLFCIETKTRRKPVSDEKGKEYRVEFDGSCLRWPWGTNTHGLDQAINNAETLSEWLSSAVGDPVHATAILTLSGWVVDRKGAPKLVHVLNPKAALTGRIAVWDGRGVSAPRETRQLSRSAAAASGIGRQIFSVFITGSRSLARAKMPSI